MQPRFSSDFARNERGNERRFFSLVRDSRITWADRWNAREARASVFNHPSFSFLLQDSLRSFERLLIVNIVDKCCGEENLFSKTFQESLSTMDD